MAAAAGLRGGRSCPALLRPARGGSCPRCPHTWPLAIPFKPVRVQGTLFSVAPTLVGEHARGEVPPSLWAMCWGRELPMHVRGTPYSIVGTKKGVGEALCRAHSWRTETGEATDLTGGESFLRGDTLLYCAVHAMDTPSTMSYLGWVPSLGHMYIVRLSQIGQNRSNT